MDRVFLLFGLGCLKGRRMNFFEAYHKAKRENKPLRRPVARHTGSDGEGWISLEFIMAHFNGGSVLTEDDFVEEDWEVRDEEKK